MINLSCFKAYDIRGKVPEELNEQLAYKIGYAFSHIIKPGTVIVGYDVRLESPSLTRALIKGLIESGSNVINIGLCGTEEVYFHTFDNQIKGVGGGIMITASHNPKGYNGMKMVGMGAKPISLCDELQAIHDYLVKTTLYTPSMQPGVETIRTDKSCYIKHLLQYIDTTKLKPLKIVVNPGNGPAGTVLKLLEQFLPFQFIYIYDKPDGNFPNGVPNPMIIENRAVTKQAVLEHKADFGVAWDGDFDRCFLFDHTGNFIESYYIVGLLAESFLKKYPNQKIVHDPRLTWNTVDIVKQAGGTAIQSKSGHSFIKTAMRLERAIYGGEMSAHHYFKHFAYCDSGMIPWLLIAELISLSEENLYEMVQYRINKFPCSGEINYKVTDADKTMQKVKNHFISYNPKIDYTDGISLEFDNWRLNLRRSNTEPLIRLNIEVKRGAHSIGFYINEVETIINGR